MFQNKVIKGLYSEISSQRFYKKLHSKCICNSVIAKMCCFAYLKVYVRLFQDLPAALRCISNFLGRNLSEEVIQKIAEHCSFKTMKANSMSNFSLVPKLYMDSDKSPFLRKGEAPCAIMQFPGHSRLA